MAEIPIDFWVLLGLVFSMGIYFARNEILQRNNCNEHLEFRTDLDALLDFHHIPRKRDKGVN